jgi:hypothetical protein
MNTPPVIVDFKLGFSSGAGGNVALSYCGPLPKVDINPHDIPVALRALADKLEEVQNNDIADGIAAGMAAAAVTNGASKRQKPECSTSRRRRSGTSS